MTDVFFDTNVLIYFLELNSAKADISERILMRGGVVSVQVLNEFISVARRKYDLPWDDIRISLGSIFAASNVVPLTIETHERCLIIAERHKLNIYDAMIIASAQLAGCRTLYTEDLQDGLVIDGLTVRNPYA